MNHKNKIAMIAVHSALLVLAGGSIITAQAQQIQNTSDSGSGNADVKRVLITGSNIKTVDAETASPVQVIKREDIARQGVTNVADLISNLSASTGGLSDIVGANSFAPGGTSVSLRNLGEQSVLVLVNGRRIATYGFADFANVFSNVDSVPIDAIERVEILKSGASAIYGSDAVAGVINIITRQNYQGVDLSVDSARSLQSHTFGTSKASITAGFGNLDDDGFNILINADIFKRNNVNYDSLLKYTNASLTSSSNQYGVFNGYSNPGNIIDGPNTQARPGCAPSLLINGTCVGNQYAVTQAVPASDRKNLFVTGTFNLGGGTQAFSELMVTKSKTSYYYSPPAYAGFPYPVVWANPNTGQPLTFNYLGLPANSPLNPTGDAGAGLQYRFTDAPNYNNLDGTQFRILGGLRGSFDKYEWETAAGLTQSRVKQTQQGTFSSAGFISQIGDFNNYNTAQVNPNTGLYTANDPNFFNQPNGYHPGQQNSQAVLNTLFPVYSNTGKTQSAFADAKISGPLMTLPAGEVLFNVGGELRHESMALGVSPNLQSGDMVGYGISTAGASRNIESVYGELNVPVIKNMDLSPALRLDKFPGIATHFSPKLDLRYKLSDAVLLRAGFERGFRAPNLVESATSLKFAFIPGTSDPLRCPQASALNNDLSNALANLSPTSPLYAALQAKQAQVISNECSQSVPDEVKNNPSLKPETSKSFNFGIVLEPIKGYSTSLDYWHISRSNTVGLASAQQLIALASNNQPTPGSSVNRAPLTPNGDRTFSANNGSLNGQNDFTQYGVTTGAIQNIVQSLQNISEQSTSGVDISGRINQKLGGWGTFSTVMDATYNRSYYDSSISTASENLIGQYGFPRIAANATFIWDFHHFSNSLRYNYSGGTSLQQGQSDTQWNTSGCVSSGLTAKECHLASNRTTDYGLFYSGINNLTLGANILNLFQQKAPPNFRAFGINGAYPASFQDAQGRILRLSLAYKFK